MENGEREGEYTISEHVGEFITFFMNLHRRNVAQLQN